MQKSANDIREKPGVHRGILDPANAARQFRLRRYLPSANLAPFVEHYWIIRWDLRGRQPYVSEVLPYPSINIAFTADRAWVTGVTTGRYDYEVKDAGIVVGCMFRPGAFYAYWPNGMAGLTNKTMPLAEVFPEADEGFRRSLLDLQTDKAMVVRVEGLLDAREPALDPSITLVNRIVDAVKAHKDLHSVQAAAARFRMSERAIQHLFHRYVGVGLKWIIMRYRLQEAAELAAGPESPNWAGIAADLGYTDQSHFVNDFKRIIGRSPRQYAKSIHSRE